MAVTCGRRQWAAIGRDRQEDPGSVRLAFVLLDLITPRSLLHDNSWSSTLINDTLFSVNGMCQ